MQLWIIITTFQGELKLWEWWPSDGIYSSLVVSHNLCTLDFFFHEWRQSIWKYNISPQQCYLSRLSVTWCNVCHICMERYIFFKWMNDTCRFWYFTFYPSNLYFTLSRFVFYVLTGTLSARDGQLTPAGRVEKRDDNKNSVFPANFNFLIIYDL